MFSGVTTVIKMPHDDMLRLRRIEHSVLARNMTEAADVVYEYIHILVYVYSMDDQPSAIKTN